MSVANEDGCGAVMRRKERVFSHGTNQLNSCPSMLDDDDSYDSDSNSKSTVHPLHWPRSLNTTLRFTVDKATWYTHYSLYGSVNWLLHTIAKNSESDKEYFFAPNNFNTKTPAFLKWKKKYLTRSKTFKDNVVTTQLPYKSIAKVSSDGRVAVIEGDKISTMRKPTWFTKCPSEGGTAITATTGRADHDMLPQGLVAGRYIYHGFCDSDDTCETEGTKGKKTVMGTKPNKGRIVKI
jgi:hypothetical protein